MPNLRILVAEDNPTHAAKIEMILSQIGYDMVGLFSTTEETLRMFHALKPDLVILDIELENNGDGVEIANKINSLKPTPIIFATSFEDKETIMRALREKPYAYLVKPISKGALQAAIELASYQFSIKEEKIHTPEYNGWSDDLLMKDSFFVKTGGKLVKLLLTDILWIELADERYCEVVTEQKKYRLRTSLNMLEEKLNSKLFVRVHRSTIVNIMKIDDIDETDLTVSINGNTLLMGKIFKTVLLKQIKTL